MVKNANEQTAHMFIISPFSGKNIASGISNLFRTHPTTRQRVERLNELSRHNKNYQNPARKYFNS